MRSILTVGGWTLLSRGAGFARDMMIAAYLGAGPVADAFNVAFSLPNMFRRFFAEGGAAAAGPIPAVFVYEGPVSGAGETVSWSNAARLAGQGRMILAGGLDADNVATAIREAQPWGVDVSSGVESAPGQKDMEKIRQFIGAARAAEIEG